MGYLLLGIVFIWGVWAFFKSITNRIRNSIEDNAIHKSGLEQSLNSEVESINSRMDGSIEQLRVDVSSFRNLAHQKLPHLKERIERDGRRQDYIRFVLPNKKQGRRRR